MASGSLDTYEKLQLLADASRFDLATDFILRRTLETEHMERRIRENTEGQLERASRTVARALEATP